MATEEEVIKKLKGVVDPHTGDNVYDMGMIPELKVKEDTVDLTFTPTTPLSFFITSSSVAIVFTSYESSCHAHTGPPHGVFHLQP